MTFLERERKRLSAERDHRFKDRQHRGNTAYRVATIAKLRITAQEPASSDTAGLGVGIRAVAEPFTAIQVLLSGAVAGGLAISIAVG